MKTTKDQRAEWLRLEQEAQAPWRGHAALIEAARNALRPLIEDVEELERRLVLSVDHNEHVAAECRRLVAERDQLRETNARLNRRCQQAESDVASLRGGEVQIREWVKGEQFHAVLRLEQEVERLRKLVEGYEAEDEKRRHEYEKRHPY